MVNQREGLAGAAGVDLQSSGMTWNELDGSRWEGTSELWEDPLGDVAQTSDCTIAFDGDTLTYTWSYNGQAHVGTLKSTGGNAEFRDSWHQDTPVACEAVPGSPAIAAVTYAYMENWGWRIILCHRSPTGELVLQMTNIAPWGEEARAVRMVCARVGA